MIICVKGTRQPLKIIFVNLNFYPFQISCLVTYFSPSLGLLGMMNHHHAERFPLDPEIWNNLKKTDFHYLNAITGQYQTIPVSVYLHLIKYFKQYNSDIVKMLKVVPI